MKLEPYEIVQKLIGKIHPIGESNEDSKRLYNIEQFIELAEAMVAELDSISLRYKDSQEYSVKLIWAKANSFVKDLEVYNHNEEN